MIVRKVEATNFGSYKQLSFNFENLGLCLIHGETGSGKSTLQDIIPWCLFGITAKNGLSDDVLNWNSKAKTQVTVELDSLSVTRIRGKATENDLFWVEDGIKHRGKNIVDTQQLLCDRLKINEQTFINANYYHEFSRSASFFSDPAKKRKELFETIADIQFPLELSKKLAASKKLSKNDSIALEIELASVRGASKNILSILETTKVKENEWIASQRLTELGLMEERKHFESLQKSKIEALELQFANRESQIVNKLEKIEKKLIKLNKELLEDKSQKYQKLKDEPEFCKTCKQALSNAKIVEVLTHQHKRQEQLKTIKNLELDKITLLETPNPYEFELETERTRTDNSEVLLTMLRNQVNPHTATIKKYEHSHAETLAAITALESKKVKLSKNISVLTDLNDLTASMRKILLENSVHEVETETNRVLTTYFDTPFQVGLEIIEDDLEVSLTKGDTNCRYLQLSKGQRQLLKLAFSIAIMKRTSMESGINTQLLMFDEALDGLDSELKIKAFNLFEELSLQYGSVLLIDHSPDLQNLFTRKFHVKVVSGDSEIREDE